MKNWGKMIFWIVSPFVFAGFFRLFFLFFYFICGWAIVLILGERLHLPVLLVSVAASLISTLLVVVILYKMFVKHVLQ